MNYNKYYQLTYWPVQFWKSYTEYFLGHKPPHIYYEKLGEIQNTRSLFTASVLYTSLNVVF